MTLSDEVQFTAFGTDHASVVEDAHRIAREYFGDDGYEIYNINAEPAARTYAGTVASWTARIVAYADEAAS